MMHRVQVEHLVVFTAFSQAFLRVTCLEKNQYCPRFCYAYSCVLLILYSCTWTLILLGKWSLAENCVQGRRRIVDRTVWSSIDCSREQFWKPQLLVILCFGQPSSSQQHQLFFVALFFFWRSKKALSFLFDDRLENTCSAADSSRPSVASVSHLHTVDLRLQIEI